MPYSSFSDRPVNTICLFLVSLLLQVVLTPAKIINTTNGLIQGLEEIHENTKLGIYLGVPYGKPPIGNLRFRRPEKVETWDGVKLTTDLPPTCPQGNDTSFDRIPGIEMWNPNTRLSEDCLYLNIWAPIERSKQPRAVMVWIYGGGFYSGTSTLAAYDGRNLAAHYDVIVVSIQYRVGPLGFLFLPDSDAPGNAGLVDQQLALRWVRENILKFGGDPDRITLFGESAGAASVSLHLLSPRSKPHFNNAIMQSGSSLNTFAFSSHEISIRNSEDVARKVGCKVTNNKEILECLYEVDALELWRESEHLRFRPTIDGYFLVEPPADTVKRGSFKHTNIITGFNKNEGSWFLISDHSDITKPFETKSITKVEFSDIVESSVGKRIMKSPIIYEAVDYEYGVSHRNGASYLNLADNVYGDMFINCPVKEFTDYYADTNNTVYTFFFEHRSEGYQWSEWMGAIHGIEIDYVFGNPLYNFTKEEMELSDKVMTFWTNFAKTG